MDQIYRDTAMVALPHIKCIAKFIMLPSHNIGQLHDHIMNLNAQLCHYQEWACLT